MEGGEVRQKGGGKKEREGERGGGVDELIYNQH